ncbi:MAG: EAL domain-containing protein [Gammaproteobacteria bacterium]|nr:EAL domain-containing protein [Gammaproteobacteria bacterium]
MTERPSTTAVRDDVPAVNKESAVAAERVLIADDDPALLQLMETTLRAGGFDVVACPDGGVAVSQCADFRPQLVLLDIEMPTMDGISACKRLRQQGGNENLPIVMVTGADDKGSVEQAFAAGATDFITKPINWPLFEHRVRGFLEVGHVSAELEASAERLDKLGKAAPEIVLVVSRDGSILDRVGFRAGAASSAAADEPEHIGEIWSDKVASKILQLIRRVLKTREPVDWEFDLDDDNHRHHYDVAVSADGRDRALVVVREATDAHESQDEVYRLAFWDTATGLANRHLFERIATECITEARLEEHGLAFLCIALDGVDNLANDLPTTEYAEALKAIAIRLASSVRDSDTVARLDDTGEGQSLARLGDNQFALVLRGMDLQESLQTFSDRVLQLFSEPLRAGDRTIDVTPRIGIALFPSDGQDVPTLLEAATSAMHEARLTGADAPHYWSVNQTANGLAAMDMCDELRHALRNGHFELHYQQRVNIHTGETTGAEALLRWPHPLRGSVSLEELLPLAETAGLLVSIGEWVLQEACRQIAEWQREGLAIPRVSINLSRQEFFQSDLPERLRRALERAGLAPEHLELEFTEAAVMRGKQSLEDLQELKDLGVGLVLDDFGTGHSSLFHLRYFPLDAIKIDQAFVQGLGRTGPDRAICETVVTLAHRLRLRAIAEGVETPEQLAHLRQLGCNEAQGYLISQPLAADEFAASLKHTV